MNKLLMLVLKASNLVSITVYSFALIYVLVRVVTPEFYPAIVLIAAVGNYVLAADLGYAGVVYASVRKAYVEGTLEHRRAFIVEALNVYLLIALAAAAVVAVGISLMGGVAPDLKLALSIFFLSIVLSMPWSLFRKTAAAMDLFIESEIIELCRRCFFLGLAASMLAGLPFLAFGLACCLTWVVAFGVMMVLVRRRGVKLAPVPLQQLGRHLAENRVHVFRSGWLTGGEFMIYNFPYLAIPALFHDPMRLVVFDVFYKIFRFGAVAYAVPAETFLPHQTRAYYNGEIGKVMKYARLILLIGLVPLAGAAGILLLFGDPFFHRLLDGAATVDGATVAAMIAMLAAMLAQVGAGTFLVGVNQYARLGRLALITVSLMAVLTVATAVLRLPFQTFLWGYVAVYGVHALMFQWTLNRFVRESTGAGPPPVNLGRPQDPVSAVSAAEAVEPT